jgi:nucleotide-binding universal stress UspA family protein
MPEVRRDPVPLPVRPVTPAPTPFPRIVVGTDGSDSAERALDHVVRLARRTGAEVVVTHAYPRPRHPDAGRELGSSLLRDAAARYGDGVPCRTALREGNAADMLVEVAREEEGALIAIGNRGLGGRRVSIGTVPSRVAHGAGNNVLIVQTLRAVPSEPYSRLLIATDGSPTADRAVATGMELAVAVDAPVLLLHVGDARRGDEVLSRTIGEYGGANVDPQTVEGDPAGRIVEVAEAEDCDLVVVGNRGMTGARRFTGSVPSRVAHRAPGHVLVVKTT